MKRSSLQLRLFAAAALAVIASLSLAGVAISALFESQARQIASVELSNTLHLLLAQVKVGTDGRLFVATPPSDPRFAVVYGGLYWQIAEHDGVRLRSRSLWDESLNLSFGEADHRAEHIFMTKGPQGESLLVAELWVEIASPQGPRQLQLAAASEADAIARARRSFEGPLFYSLAILALGLVCAAWIFVRIGLKPFERLRTDLAAVHEGRAARLSGTYPDEVQPVVRDLNELLRRQEDIAARGRARAADLAHGLKTPLAVLDALAGEVRRDGKVGLADEIAAEIAAMKGHVERELARARGERPTPWQRQQTPVRPIIDRLVGALSKIADRDDLRFEIVCAPQLLFSGSENDLLEMLGNLLDNARKWATSRVRVSTECRAGKLFLRVEDDGPGLSADLRSEDITRPVRLDERHTGIGFGLAICKDLAEANEGRIALAVSALGGLEVELVFPT